MRFRKTRKILFSFICSIAFLSCNGPETKTCYLSGTDKDHTVDWQFYCSDGMNSGQWTTIAVPSCWELQGFGGYNYGIDGGNIHREQGHYKHSFSADKAWHGKRVFLKFEGVMTDATVQLNNQLLGSHQGAFYPFKFEITDLLKFDEENTLDVIVEKDSKNESIHGAERSADYWVFGGIFRPVKLEIMPLHFIERVAIDARHDGQFSMLVYPDSTSRDDVTVEMNVQTLDGKRIGKCFKNKAVGPDGSINLVGKIDNPKQWTAETPYLYNAVFRLKKGHRVLHEYHQRFGFRTIEFRYGEGFFLNGTRIQFKGVCRHTFWPESGRTSSKDLALEDVRLMKEMNMNAVRMSHYPPDTYFLDVCDSLGMYVLDELGGWQHKYDTPTAHRLVKEMIQRDVNHPSIVAWDNGNEGGFNMDIRRDYAILDPQHRHLIEPWSLLDGLNTRHYPGYWLVRDLIEEKKDVIMPTESLHGLQDGGHGAALEDYWELMRGNKYSAGMFLWDFADEGVVRRDLNDSIDVVDTKAPDGILGPHHEKEGSFFTIKQIWCPVHVKNPCLNDSFDGSIEVENRYDFTDLSNCGFRYALLRFNNPFDGDNPEIQEKQIPSVSVLPWQTGTLQLELPDDWRSYDVLSLTAASPEGQELFTWKWNISDTHQVAERLTQKGSTLPEEEIRTFMAQLNPRITASNEVNNSKIDWHILDNGLVRVDYAYTLNGEYDYAGLSISYPEKGVTAASLLANGPYRVWKNRLKGPVFGYYEKEYNNTITGQNWIYPEFKGYYANFYAVKIHGTETHDVSIITDDTDKYLQLYTPQRPQYTTDSVNPPFPDADISVLSVIPAIGTKFSSSKDEGPSSLKATFENKEIRGTIFIRIG